MKQSVWGYAALVLGVTAIMMTWFFTQTTNTDQHNYNLLKETVENAMYDALDLSYYRAYSKLTEEEKLELSEKGEYAPLRIDEQKFIESFLRRFAENADLSNTYRIDIYDILETPPKVSLKVTTIKDASGATASGGDVMNFSIVNNIDAILEARWQGEFAEEYKVVFDMNGGSSNGNKKIERGYEEGDALIWPDKPSLTGSSFVNWTCDGEDVEHGTSMAVMRDMTCVANYDVEEITVYFHINLTGTGYTSPAKQIFTRGVSGQKFGYKDGKPEWPQTGQFGIWDSADYKLLGWSHDKNDDKATYARYCNVIDEWIEKHSPSVDLYAVWSKWSNWSETKPTCTDCYIEEQTRYRSRTISYSDSWTGWTKSSTAPAETITTSTKKSIIYYRYYASKSGNIAPASSGDGASWPYIEYHEVTSQEDKLSFRDYSSLTGYTSYKMYGDYSTDNSSRKWWYVVGNGANEFTTYYNYYVRKYTYGSWSDWTTIKSTASSTLQVESRTYYRYANK